MQCEHTVCLPRLHASLAGQKNIFGIVRQEKPFSALVRVLSQQQDMGRACAGEDGNQRCGCAPTTLNSLGQITFLSKSLVKWYPAHVECLLPQHQEQGEESLAVVLLLI